MLNLRDFYSIITKPADTSRGVVLLLPDKTVVFNEFKNIMYEMDIIFYEQEYGIMTFYIEQLKSVITTIDEQLEKGQKKPEINIELKSLVQFNILGNKPLFEVINQFKLFTKVVHSEEFNPSIKESILANKANAGRYNYIVDANDKKYLMMIYKGLIPITKNDKVNLSIQRIDTSIYEESELSNNVFLGKFIVYRKKDKLTITEYILFRDL